jgi:hypothetical protein
MTAQELNDNYEYKITKRALIKEFPFIKDVSVKEEAINKWSGLIYIDLIIDPFVFAQQYGFRVWGPIINVLKRGENYRFPYISIFIGNSDRVELASPVNKAMEELTHGIHKSPAIPHELKLGKELVIGTFTATPSSLPPDMLSPQ